MNNTRTIEIIETSGWVELGFDGKQYFVTNRSVSYLVNSKLSIWEARALFDAVLISETKLTHLEGFTKVINKARKLKLTGMQLCNYFFDEIEKLS